jgi:transposase-like protein
MIEARWIRHRLRALMLKHWKNSITAYRLIARGQTHDAAKKVANNVRSWWRNSASNVMSAAFPIQHFDKLGVPRLTA